MIICSLLVDVCLTRQVASLSHSIHHVQVLLDLVRLGQGCFLRYAPDLIIEVRILVLKRDVLGRDTVEVDSLVVEPVEVARDVVETVLSLLGLW